MDPGEVSSTTRRGCAISSLGRARTWPDGEVVEVDNAEKLIGALDQFRAIAFFIPV